jgi:hypothetical protein
MLGQAQEALAYSQRALDDCNYLEKRIPQRYSKYLAGSAYLLQGHLKERAGDAIAARSNFGKAVQSFSSFIEYMDSKTQWQDDLRRIQEMGKAYLGRAKARERLGQHDLAAADRAFAEKLGVTFDYQCNRD